MKDQSESDKHDFYKQHSAGKRDIGQTSHTQEQIEL